MFTSYLLPTCFVVVVKYGFAHRHFLFKRILKCHPNLSDSTVISSSNMATLVKIWHLAEWNEVLSCCLFWKLHLLFVKIRRCSQYGIMNRCCNFFYTERHLKATASWHPNWIAFDHYQQSTSTVYETLSFCFQSFCIQDIKTLLAHGWLHFCVLNYSEVWLYDLTQFCSL